MLNYVDFNELQGRSFYEITRGYDQITFKGDGVTYIMRHEQDCCEHVYIESIVGDLEDLLNTPITGAEEVVHTGSNEDGSETWTFYKLRSRKGYVDIRWHGESNGYYSESVSLIRYDD